jgi:hypothetical protein
MGSTTDNSIVAITGVVSEALETPLEELPPLSRRIEIDALERLVSSPASARPPGVLVTFEYAGLTVVVHSCGIVYAEPIDDSGETVLSTREFHP